MDLISGHIQSISKWINLSRLDYQTLFMHVHIIVSALFPIYVGAHASLRCPPSARPADKRQKGDKGDDFEEDEDENNGDYFDDIEETVPEIQGLQPSDAIVFPVLAGCTLSALYLLIKWLDDPQILNRILNWYFSGVGIFGVAKLAIDSLNVITTFIFPRVWSTKTNVFLINPTHSTQSVDQALKVDNVTPSRPIIQSKTNPFPGFLSTIQFPKLITSKLWSLRALLCDRFIFRGYVRNLFHVVSPVRLNDINGFIFGLITIIIYNIYGRFWWLTNVIAFGFCYGALQLISPTTFWTGSLVLFGLFIYDIIMVFYTPLMITVAGSLEVPIKLIFPGPQRGSMLGLGDVVLPGIMIALALRFDLYLHYYYKQSISLNVDKKVVREKYSEATGLWGERFWTSSSKSETKLQTIADGARFRKVYFWASIFGYIVGLMVTLLILKIFSHAQPALLYLVPAVLSMLWVTAWIRGEIGLMWEYTEDTEWGSDHLGIKKKIQDTVCMDEKKETIEDKNIPENNLDDKVSNKVLSTKSSRKWPRDKQRLTQHLFLFSLTIPRLHLKKVKLSEQDALMSDQSTRTCL